MRFLYLSHNVDMSKQIHLSVFLTITFAQAGITQSFVEMFTNVFSSFILNFIFLLLLIILIFLLTEKNFPQLKHSHDIWHAAKNIGKKIVKVNKKRFFLFWKKRQTYSDKINFVQFFFILFLFMFVCIRSLNDDGKNNTVIIWAASWQKQQNDCAPSLIRVFVVRMKKAWTLSYPLRWLVL